MDYIKKQANAGMVNLLIPESVENLQLPAPELLNYYKNLENRILWMDMDVDDMFLEFGKYIVMWNQEDAGKPAEERKPIRLFFFSPGGSLSINNAMVDIIKASKTKIIGINIGVAYSAGCFIYLACHERLAMPNATFLIHKGSGEFHGTYDEIISQINEYSRQIDELYEYVMDNTKITEEILEDKFGTEWYITATEAVELGVCDKIITDIDQLFLPDM